MIEGSYAKSDLDGGKANVGHERFREDERDAGYEGEIRGGESRPGRAGNCMMALFGAFSFIIF